jgi:hypothetical protein
VLCVCVWAVPRSYKEDSWGNQVSVGIGCQETTSEHREDFMCAVVTVILGVYDSVGLLQLVVVAIRKWSIDPVSNPKPRRETL